MQIFHSCPIDQSIVLHEEIFLFIFPSILFGFHIEEYLLDESSYLFLSGEERAKKR